MELLKEIMKTGETAEYLGVSRQWLEIARSGRFGPPWVKLGPKTVRYRRSSLTSYLDEIEVREAILNTEI